MDLDCDNSSPGFVSNYFKDSCVAIEPTTISWLNPWAFFPLLLSTVGIILTLEVINTRTTQLNSIHPVLISNCSLINSNDSDSVRIIFSFNFSVSPGFVSVHCLQQGLHHHGLRSRTLLRALGWNPRLLHHSLHRSGQAHRAHLHHSQVTCQLSSRENFNYVFTHL